MLSSAAFNPSTSVANFSFSFRKPDTSSARCRLLILSCFCSSSTFLLPSSHLFSPSSRSLSSLSFSSITVSNSLFLLLSSSCALCSSSLNAAASERTLSLSPAESGSSFSLSAASWHSKSDCICLDCFSSSVKLCRSQDQPRDSPHRSHTISDHLLVC